MLSDEEQAHLEGAKNLWRYNKGDLFNICCVVGLVLICAGACWGILHLIELIPPPHQTPHYYGHINDHVGQQIPAFHGPTFNTGNTP